MRASILIVLGAGLAFGAACGTATPTAPSSLATPAESTVAAAEAAVGSVATAATALGQTLILGSPGANVITTACPEGGSIVMTYTVNPPPASSSTFRSSSRIEARDCKRSGTTVNGDPSLEMNAEHSLDGLSGPTPTLIGGTSTIRMTGAQRYSYSGTQGRVQYDCTTVTTMTYPPGGGAPRFSTQSSGTITWEHPTGTRVGPCGPA